MARETTSASAAQTGRPGREYFDHKPQRLIEVAPPIFLPDQNMSLNNLFRTTGVSLRSCWKRYVIIYILRHSVSNTSLAFFLNSSSPAPSSLALLVRCFSVTPPTLHNDSPREESIFTKEHREMRGALRKLIEKEINPYVDDWEAAKAFPAHEVR